MSKPVVVKAGTEKPDPLTGMSYPIPKTLARLHDVADIIITDDESEETLIKAVVGATVLMITYGKVSRAVLKAGQPSLKAVIKMGTGIDSIDFDAAREMGVRIANCPGYARHAVAECAFLLMMNCLKKFIPINQNVSRDGWLGATEEAKSFELFGKTVGLVGFGHINSKLATMCQGFAMPVQAYDPYVSAATMADGNVGKIKDLMELAKTSDIVSVCLPLNDETSGIISAEVLQAMKPSAFLINVGRGDLVDELAMLEVLRNGKIAGCGLDVFAQEPLNKTDHALRDLIAMDNVVIMPHLAAWTHDTWDRLQDEVSAHVLNVLEGRDLEIGSNDPRLQNQPGCNYPP
jgi:D-3-phosphoglycerate dehydrogenase